MDLQHDWTKIRQHFRSSFKTNLHVSIASVDEFNQPTVTPIGSFFLNDDQSGFYFEKYPSHLPEYALLNPKICVMAVNSNTWFWLVSLFKGRFDKYPAVKLYGLLGNKRKATPDEQSRLVRRMRRTKGLKGHAYLWENMEYIREVRFLRAEKINLGRMTEAL